jgi:hypothetical protein
VREIWVPLKGYEGFYEISNLGRVWSLGRTIRGVRKGSVCSITYKPKILKQQLSAKGYYRVPLYKNNKMSVLVVHKLVALHFLNPIPGKPLVLHGPKGSKCNIVTNLRYGTAGENTQDMWRDGTMRATPAEVVKALFEEFAEGKTKAELSRKYKLGESTVGRILNRKRKTYLDQGSRAL